MNEDIFEPVEQDVQQPRTKPVPRKLSPKTIRLKALRDFMNADGNIVLTGTEADVPCDLADMLLMPFEGPYDFAGYRLDTCATRARIFRAEKVVTQ